VALLTPGERGDVSALVGALRRAKRRVTFEVGLADLAGELTTREVAHTLTVLADAAIGYSMHFASHEQRGTVPHAPASAFDDDGILPRADEGLAIIAMGTFGGHEIGYGSDLDLFFVYSGDDSRAEHYARLAQRVLRLMETPHDEGPGYALDTRLRPSGNQGLLVVSLDGFARYQDEHAADWERQALVKARPCGGDLGLCEKVMEVIARAAYEGGAPDPRRLQHLRGRMERELGRERLNLPAARYDLKVGRGGLVDVEFATQWLQMRHGTDRRVRTTETEVALTALETCGYLEPALAEVFREGWRFLRRLEQRLRISHGTSVRLIEEGAPGLASLARRMGLRDGPRGPAEQALLERYVSVTSAVRDAFLRVVGLA
jgi:glutamate-ammonia-ligase adenylyltransferase